MELNLDTTNPAHATIEKLLSPPVDVLLRPPGGWKRPDDLLGALSKKIATNQGERLARGAAPALVGGYRLLFDGNPASDAAKQAVQDALKNRK